MPIFRVGGTDAAGERFERRRFEAADEASLRTMLAGHGVSVESVRRVGLTRWPFVRHGWPVLIWPLLAFLVLGACARLGVTALVLWAVHTEHPLYEQLARQGRPGEAEVKSVRTDRQDRSFEWGYAFEATDGQVVTGVLQRGFGSIRERRFDVSLVGSEPAVGQRFPVTFLGARPAVHVPGRMDAGSIETLDAAVRTVQWQGVLALGVALASIWGVRNILLRLGSNYWLDDDGTVIEYAGRRPVTLRLDLERDAEPEPEDTG